MGSPCAKSELNLGVRIAERWEGRREPIFGAEVAWAEGGGGRKEFPGSSGEHSQQTLARAGDSQ